MFRISGEGRNGVRLAIAGSAVAMLAVLAQAETVYQLTGNVTGGIDLLNMSGYYADRLKGPSSGNVTVSGEITHAAATDENPFQLIGAGGARTATFAEDTKLLGVPMRLSSADGVSTWSRWKFTGLRFLSPATNIVVDTLNRLTLEDNKTISIVGDYSRSQTYDFMLKGELYGYVAFVVGETAGNANMAVDGGTIFLCSDFNKTFYIGRCNKPSRTDIAASVALTNATVSCGDFILMYGCKQNNIGSLGDEKVFLDIGPGTKITMGRFQMTGGSFSRIRFSGGRTVHSSANNEVFYVTGYDIDGGNPSPVLTVEAADGAPIDIEIPADRNLCGGSSGRKVHITGAGGFVKRGNGILTWTPISSSPFASICNYTGPTTINGGGIKLSNAAYVPGRGALSVDAGAFLDLNGIDATFIGASGAGDVRNTSETAATLMLGYGDGDGDLDIAVSNSVSLVKVGAGTLTVRDGAAEYAGDLTVSGGVVKVASGVSMTGLGVVTVEKGTTLDLRGAGLKCKRLVRRGLMITDGDTDLAIGDLSAEDSVGPIALPGRLVKDGSGALTVYADGSRDCDVEVKDGRLVVYPSYPGKFFKVQVVGTTTTANKYHMYNTEFSLYDAAGNRINEHEWTYNALPGTGALDSYGGISDTSQLSEWEVAMVGTSTYNNHLDGEGPEKAMDGNLATCFDLRSWWASSAFAFRLPATASDAVGYTFTTHISQQNSLPAQWRIYGSLDGKDWTPLDVNVVEEGDDEGLAAAVAAVPTTVATEYNRGVPYSFRSYGGVYSGSPLGTGVVSVAEGATLDLSSSSMQIARLSVSSSVPSGTITRFTPAANGELVLDGLPNGLGSANVPLPITVGTVESPENLKTWRVVVGGVAMDGVGVRYRNGELVVVKARGFQVIVK